jgi:hypothetical protein
MRKISAMKNALSSANNAQTARMAFLGVKMRRRRRETFFVKNALTVAQSTFTEDNALTGAKSLL